MAEIRNSTPGTVISGSHDVELIYNTGDNVTINGAEDFADVVENSYNNYVVISVRGGNDVVKNYNNQYTTIDGGAGDDSISNGGLDALILDAYGNNTVSGVGSGTIKTGAGDDVIVNADKYSIDAGDGNNTVSYAKNSTIKTGSGNDLFSATDFSAIDDSCFNEIDAGEGINTISALHHSTIKTGSGDDIFINVSYSSIDAGAGANYVSLGGGGSNTITTGDGADTVIIEYGGHSIEVGAGANYVSVGGVGDNTITTGDDSDQIIIDGSSNYNYVTAGNGSNTVSGGSGTIKTGSGDDFVSIESGYIEAGDGNNTISSGGHYTTIKTGAGDDFISITDYYGGNSIEAGDGTNYISVGGSSNTVTTGDDSDQIIIDSGSSNAVYAGAGANYVSLGGGYNTITTGDDSDQIIIDGSENYVTAGNGNNTVSGGGSGTIKTGAGDDSLVGISGSIDAGDGANFISIIGGSTVLAGKDNDTINIEGGFNSINVGDGANFVSITSGGGKDTITTGDGNDIIYIRGTAQSFVNAGSGANYISITGGAYTFNTISAGDGADTIHGDGGASINAGSGANLISLSSGNNTISVGDDNDNIYIFGESSSINAGSGDNFVSVSGNSNTINAGDGADTIHIDGGRSSINAGAGSNLISVSNGYNTVNVGDDNDNIYIFGESSSINAGSGDNFVSVSGNSNTINAGDGADTIYSVAYSSINAGAGANLISVSNGYNTVNVGDDNDNIYIYGESSSINAGSGANYISLGSYTDENGNLRSGNNTVTSGAGNDTIEIEGSGNSVSVGDGDNIINVYGTTSASNTIFAGSGDDTISSNYENLTTNIAENDFIDAGNGDNLIDILVMHSTITTGTGNDTIKIIGNGRKNIDVGEGANYISINQGSDDDYSAGTNTVISGEGNDTIIIASSFANSIEAGDGDNYVSLQGDHSTVITGDGNDTIINTNDGFYNAGAGKNLIVLNADNGLGNTIIAGAGDDTIQGFNWADVVSLEGNYITLRSGTNFYIQNNGHTILLTDIDSNFAPNIQGGVLIADTTSGGDEDGWATINSADGTQNVISDSSTVANGTNVDDTIAASSMQNVTRAIYGNDGNDKISVTGSEAIVSSNVTIDGGVGNDTIEIDDYIVAASVVSINGGAGADNISIGTISNDSKVTIVAGAGDNIELWTGNANYIFDSTDNVTISGSTFKASQANISAEIYQTYSVMTIGTGFSGTVSNPNMRNHSQAVVTDSYGNVIATEGTYSIVNGRFNAPASVMGVAKYNSVDGASIVGTNSTDSIDNIGSNVNISTGSGKDSIYVLDYWDRTAQQYVPTTKVTIDAGDGDDYIVEEGNYSISSAHVINAGAGNDRIVNTSKDNTINAGAGDDTIYATNKGGVVIYGEAGNDSVYSNGINSTIIGGAGDDSIRNANTLSSNLYIYNSGDGNDVIQGMTSSDTLIIDGTTYSTVASGDDIVVTTENGAVTLQNATTLTGFNIVGTISPYETVGVSINNEVGDTLITGTAYDDTISSVGDNVTINAGAGNDSVYAIGSNLTVNGDDGNDTLEVSPNKASISGGSGDDSIYTWGDGSNITISGGSGNDTIDNNITNNKSNYGLGKVFIYNTGDGDDVIIGMKSNDSLIIDGSVRQITRANDGDIKVSVGSNSITLQNYGIYNATSNTQVTGTAYADSIFNGADNATVSGDNGDDVIKNTTSNKVSLSGGEGNDTIDNWGTSNYVTIGGGVGADSIRNYAENVTAAGGEGNDTIINGYEETTGSSVASHYANYSSVSGGADNDYISNLGNNVTITGGEGNDTISSSGNSNVYVYNSGDGADVVTGFNASDTLVIGDGTGTYSTTSSGADVVVTAGEGSITLQDAINLSALNIQGSLTGGEDTDTATWTIIGTTATYGTTDSTLITITGLKDGVTTDDFSLEGTTVTLKKAALGTSTVTLTGEGYTLALANDVDTVKDVDASWSVDNGTATYKGGKTAGYSISGNTVTYSAAVDGETLATITGLKSDATASGIATKDNTITLSNSVLDQKEVTLMGEGYTLALANDVDTVKDVDASWSVDNGTATYKGGKTAGYTLSGKTVTYSAAVDGETLATITGLKSDATASGIATKDNTITLSNSVLDQKEVTLMGEGYTLALANDVDTPTAVTASWKISDGIANYRGSTTAGYVVEDNKITYQSEIEDEAIMSVTGLNADATDNDISLDNGVLTLSANAIGIDTITIENTVGVSKISAGKAGNFLIGTQTFKTDTPVEFSIDDSTNVTSIQMATTGSLTNSADNISIIGGTGNDAITNSGNKVTLSGGLGNDTITNSGDNTFFQYKNGDGDDVIVGFTENDTLKISDDTYNTTVEGGDLRVNLVNSRNSIILKDAANITPNIEGTWNSGYEDKEGKSITNPVATIVYNGETYYYESVARAVNDADNNSTVTVIANSTETAQISSTKGLTIQFAESGLGVYGVTGGNFVSADSSNATNFSISSNRVLSNSNSLLINNGATATIDGYVVTGTSNGYTFALQNSPFTLNDVAYSGAGTATFTTGGNISLTDGAVVTTSNEIKINLSAGEYTINGVEFTTAENNTALINSSEVQLNLSNNAVTYNSMAFTGANSKATFNANEIILTGGANVSNVEAGQEFTFNGSGTYKLNGKSIVTLSEKPFTVTNTDNGLTIGENTFSVTGDEEYRINVDAEGNIVSVSGINGGSTIVNAGGADSILTGSAGNFTFGDKTFAISGDDSVTFGLTNEGLLEKIADIVGTIGGNFTSAININGNAADVLVEGDNSVNVTADSNGAAAISGVSNNVVIKSTGGAATVTTDEAGTFNFYDAQNFTVQGDSSVDFRINDSVVTGISNFENGTLQFDNAANIAMNSDNLKTQFSNTATFVIADSKVVSVDGIETAISGLTNDVTVHAVGAMTVNNANVNVTGDSNFNVLVSNGSTTGLTNISSGASVSVANISATTDNNGEFKVGENVYTINDADGSVTFLTDSNGAVSDVTNFNGTLKTTARNVTINGAAFTTNNTNVTVHSAGTNITRIDGVGGGDVLSGDIDSAAVIVTVDSAEDVALWRLNSKTYMLTGDSDGVQVTGNRVDGLDNAASLEVSTAETYIVNDTALDAKVGDTIIGTAEGSAYLYDPNNVPLNVDNMTDDEIAAQTGISTGYSNVETDTEKSAALINDASNLNGSMELALSNSDTTTAQTADFSDSTGRKKVTLEEGLQDVKFNDEGGNVAVVDSNADGEKNIELGNGGDLAIIKDTTAQVNVTAGKGADSIVTAGQNVKVEMTGGATKVIPNAGNVEFENYDAEINAGIQLNDVSDITRAIISDNVSLEDGAVTFGNVKVKVNSEDAESTTVNLYNNKGKKQKVGYTHSNGGAINARNSRENILLVGNNKGNKGASNFASGSGDDIALGGAGDSFDLGAGNNSIILDENRNNSTGVTINQTATSGSTEVTGFKSDYGESSDRVNIDSSARVSYKNGKLIFYYISAILTLNFSAWSADLAESADLESDGKSKKILIGDNDNTTKLEVAETGSIMQVAGDEESRASAYVGENSGVNLSDLSEDALINLNEGIGTFGNSAVSFRGITKIQGGSGENSLIGSANSQNTIISGIGNTSMWGGGYSNDAMVGADSSLKSGSTSFFFADGDGRDTISNFEFFTAENNHTADKIDTYGGIITGAELAGDDVIIEFSDSNDRLTIKNARGKDFKVETRYTDLIIAQINNDSLNYDGYANYYKATGKNAVLTANESLSSVDIWLNNDRNFSKETFEGDIKTLDASRIDGKATLAGNTNDNYITAAQNDSSLWGGNYGDGNDTLVGGNGADMFWYGVGEGNDVITNVEGNDVVNLYNISLQDISNVDVTNNSIRINTTDGHSLTVNSNNSGIGFMLADDKTVWTVNQNSKEWSTK